MTPQQTTQWHILIEAFLTGEASENEFVEVSIDMGVSAERINSVLNQARLEDGVLS